MQTQTRLIPITEWGRFHEWPPLGGLRHLRFHEADNGFGGAFVKIGRRVLIDERRFFECIAENQEAGGHA